MNLNTSDGGVNSSRRPTTEAGVQAANGKEPSVLETALAYYRAGFSVIPIKRDGSKAPALDAWEPFKTRRATEALLGTWYRSGSQSGIALIGGKVSGGLFVLDIEFLDHFEEWVRLVEAQAPGLLARLPIIRTPGKDVAGGRHVYGRTLEPTLPSAKLSRMTQAEAERRTGDPGKTTLAEVKAEKGYVLAPGCPAECHESRRLYQHIAGPPISETPTLTKPEVAILVDSARALERGDKASADRRPEPDAGDGNRPGDDFNRRANWLTDVLPSDWKKVRENGEVIYLCRPGKDAGVSATIGYCRSKLAGSKLYVFSTNAEPFEAEKSYSKFEAYAVLNHGGDYSAAARDLAAKSYGDQSQVHGQGTNGGGGAGEGEPASERRVSAATVLVRLALNSGIELFHAPDQAAFATIPFGSRRETWPLRSKRFRQLLNSLFFQAQKKTAGSQAVQDAIAVLEGRATFGGPECPVYVRLAEHRGKTYIDLADKQWRVIEVDCDGWRIVSDSPVKFRRLKGALPLPVPVPGGSLTQLRPFVNVAVDTDWQLLVAWLLQAINPHGPYPILFHHGERGSAKSTTARVLRALIDPNLAPLRCQPRDERDLMIAANNGLVLAFDNLSRLPDWLSDALCRLATGGGFSTRELYSDDEETIFAAMRPCDLASIEDIATRGDLLERGIVIRHPCIKNEKRKTEREFWASFERVRPLILGALLDAASGAMRGLANVNLKNLPRMADFAAWVTAAEPALGWKPGSFLAAYASNQQEANDLALDASPLVAPLRKFLESRVRWEGTASELLEELRKLVGDVVAKGEDWPKKANALSGKLRRLAPNLRRSDVLVEFEREKAKGRARIIRLAIQQEQADNSSSASSGTVHNEENRPKTGSRSDDADDPFNFADDQADDPRWSETASQDDPDAADDGLQSCSDYEVF
jgi:hypothetical protein